MLSQHQNTEIIFIIVIWFAILLLFVTMVVGALWSILSERRSKRDLKEGSHEDPHE